MKSKKIAIILINFNSLGTTDDCIQSLKKVTYKDFDIIVVDNDSKDKSGDKLLELHPDIILVKSEINTGFTGGNNIGFRYSIEHNYEYSLMQNNDTFVEPDYLDPLIQYMENNPGVAAVQPRIFYNHDRSLLWNGGSFYIKSLGLNYTKGVGKKSKKVNEFIKKVDWITGCAFFVRNSVLKKSGLLSENMFMNWEDVDLSFRITNLGYDLMYIPESKIYHITSMSLKTETNSREGLLNPEAHYRHIRNNLWVKKRYTKWYFVPSVYLFNFLYTLMFIAYFTVRRRFKKLNAALRGLRDGITGSIEYTYYTKG